MADNRYNPARRGVYALFHICFAKAEKRYVRRLCDLEKTAYKRSDSKAFAALAQDSAAACAQAKMIANISGASLFLNTKQEYFSLGEEMWKRLLEDLTRAEKFIYMEYFIIEEGEFWSSILDILKDKAKAGVEVRVVYDDIGCMTTLPGNYSKILAGYGIFATPFSRLRGDADSEFNNRSHRKITVIDGYIGYTGGVNIADEYVNKTVRFGHWKDTAIRLEGEAVRELTKLFLIDYGINAKTLPATRHDLYPEHPVEANGYIMPFGDGPKPLYECRVGKSVIQNMLTGATKYAYMTTPYLIIDNDLCTAIESAARKGVDVRIITPHIPNKRLVFGMTRSFYRRLMAAGVKIYEYEPGFIHAKSYLVDGEYTMIGTVNLDYRSLVYHFENGVWLYRADVINDIKADIEQTLEKSILITPDMLKVNPITRFIRALLRLFAPML